MGTSRDLKQKHTALRTVLTVVTSLGGQGESLNEKEPLKYMYFQSWQKIISFLWFPQFEDLVIDNKLVLTLLYFYLLIRKWGLNETKTHFSSVLNILVFWTVNSSPILFCFILLCGSLLYMYTTYSAILYYTLLVLFQLCSVVSFLQFCCVLIAAQ